MSQQSPSSSGGVGTSNFGVTRPIGRGRGRGIIKNTIEVPSMIESPGDHETPPGSPGGSEQVCQSYEDFNWKVHPTHKKSSESESGSAKNEEACDSVEEKEPCVAVLEAKFREKYSAPIRKRYRVSHFFPKYTEAAKPSKRIEALKSSKVTLVGVMEGGDVMVSFQDNDSVERFARLLEYMIRFYSTTVGYDFRIQIDSDTLQVGEIVAAVIHTSDGRAMARRVQILDVFEGCSNTRAYALDIDDLNHYYVKSVFALHPVFYKHPTQACKLKLTNLRDMCPKDTFDAFFDDQEKFYNVIDDVSHRILISMIGQNLQVSNLCTSTSRTDAVQHFLGELDFSVNWNLHQRFVDEICRLDFIPTTAEEDIKTTGVITHIFPNGEISICPDSSVFKVINRITNSNEIRQLAESVTKEQQEEFMRQIRSGECSLFLAYDNKTRGIVRAKVKSFYEGKLKIGFIDMDREEIQDSSKLICPLTGNKALPPILSAIPSQAVRLHLAGVDQIERNQDVCQKMVGIEVKYKVCDTKGLFCQELEELRNEPDAELTLNELLK